MNPADVSDQFVTWRWFIVTLSAAGSLITIAVSVWVRSILKALTIRIQNVETSQTAHQEEILGELRSIRAELHQFSRELGRLEGRSIHLREVRTAGGEG